MTSAVFMFSVLHRTVDSLYLQTTHAFY